MKIQTADVLQTEKTDNIQINIQGTDGEIEKFLLKNNIKSTNQRIFQQGSLDLFEIKHKDIGQVREYLVINNLFSINY